MEAGSTRRGPYVVGISGPSRAGKSTLAEGLCDRLCGPDAVREHRHGDRRSLNRVVQYLGKRGINLSYICQDSFFLTNKVIEQLNNEWDVPQALDDDAVLFAIEHEIQDLNVHFVIFEGFKAYQDERVLPLLDLCLWLDAPVELVRQRRLKNKRCTSEIFESSIWPNHLRYIDNFSPSTRQNFRTIDGTQSQLIVLEKALEFILLGLEGDPQLKAYVAVHAQPAAPAVNERAHQYRARAALQAKAGTTGKVSLRSATSRSRSRRKRLRMQNTEKDAKTPAPLPKQEFTSKDDILGFWRRRGLLRLVPGNIGENTSEDACLRTGASKDYGKNQEHLQPTMGSIVAVKTELPQQVATEPLVRTSLPRTDSKLRMCANPNCWFLVHENGVYGGYCCNKCHWRQVSGSKPQKKHEVTCAKIFAPDGTPRADPIPPMELYNSSSSSAPVVCREEVIAEPSLPPPPCAGPGDRNTNLFCANPACKFRVHDDRALGGYCCYECHRGHVLGSTTATHHGATCARREAVKGAFRSIAVPPTGAAASFRVAPSPSSLNGLTNCRPPAPPPPISVPLQPTTPETLSRIGRALGCANPNCWFYVHEDDDMGGFCCSKCHWRYTTGMNVNKKHEANCGKVPLEDGTPRAKPVPPVKLYDAAS